MKTSFRLGLKFVENQVNGRIRGLHCTWLVPRTRASSDDMDGFLTLRADLLEEGRSTLRTWPNRYLRGHRIMLCVPRGTQMTYSAAVDLVAGLGASHVGIYLWLINIVASTRNPDRRSDHYLFNFVNDNTPQFNFSHMGLSGVKTNPMKYFSCNFTVIHMALSGLWYKSFGMT
ncbi:hypothetical protein M9H77_18106 [Catharanthus roseus]|uniref:Uncharacterized protein n=1 Tax=Catharanthus roseus TaxID=4058 RepID=A0ACC0B6I5_CATRO|nr:hypothetical protein M9H77_18106 [Catharanthus roseus]